MTKITVKNYESVISHAVEITDTKSKYDIFLVVYSLFTSDERYVDHGYIYDEKYLESVYYKMFGEGKICRTKREYLVNRK